MNTATLVALAVGLVVPVNGVTQGQEAPEGCVAAGVSIDLPGSYVADMDVSPDGLMVAATISDNTLETAKQIKGRVVLISFRGEKPDIRELPGDRAGLAYGRLRFSPDGKHLVSQFLSLPGDPSGLTVWNVGSSEKRTFRPAWNGIGGEYPKYGEPLVSYETFAFCPDGRLAIYCNPRFLQDKKGYTIWYSHAGLELRDLESGVVRFSGPMNPIASQDGNASVQPSRENMMTLRPLGDGEFMLLGTRTEKANRTIYRTKMEFVVYDAATGKLGPADYLASIPFIYPWQYSEATGNCAFFHGSTERGTWTLSVANNEGKILASKPGSGYGVLGYSQPRFSADGKYLQVRVNDSVPDEKATKQAKPGTTVSTVTRSGMAILEAATLKEVAFYSVQNNIAVLPSGKFAVTSARNYKAAKPTVTFTIQSIPR